MSYVKASLSRIIVVGLLSTIVGVACGELHPRPDLARSTLTLPGDERCVRGHKAIPSHIRGELGYPVTVVLDESCERAR